MVGAMIEGYSLARSNGPYVRRSEVGVIFEGLWWALCSKVRGVPAGGFFRNFRAPEICIDEFCLFKRCARSLRSFFTHLELFLTQSAKVATVLVSMRHKIRKAKQRSWLVAR